MADPATTATKVGMKCVDSIFQCCLPPLEAIIGKRIQSFLCLEENWESLKTEKEKLKAKHADVERKVMVAENQLKDPKEIVRLWQKRAKQHSKTLSENTTIKEEYEGLGRCLCNCTPNLLLRDRIAKKVGDDLQGVQKLIEDLDALTSLADESLPNIVDRRPSLQSFGLGSAMEQLQDYFYKEDKSIIAIHGIGGVGKTTLLSEFNNRLKIILECDSTLKSSEELNGSLKTGDNKLNGSLKRSRFFDVVIFVTLSYSSSQILNVEDLQQTIADRVGLPLDVSKSEKVRSRILCKALEKKKFVILLDDVREAFDLESVGIPKPNKNNKCKLIFTSRSAQVCAQMNAQRSMIKVKCLDKEAAWELFQSNLSENAVTAIEENDDIKRHAESIVCKCGGLPLALTVIGKAVTSLVGCDEWSSAEQILMAAPFKDRGMDLLFTKLKYSYDKLNPSQQRCFLYCALFPQHNPIKKKRVIEYWMAEGLTDTGYEGQHIISALITASLLERGDQQWEVRMHDIIRDLALWLASDCGKSADGGFLVGESCSSNQTPKVKRWEGATKISLVSSNIVGLPESPECTSLETLLLQNNPKLLKLPSNLFTKMPKLKVLDLSHTAIEEFPVETDVLGELEHLNLCHTRIAKLPEKLSALKKLKYLNLKATTALIEIPRGTVSALFSLRVLNLYKSRYGMRKVEDLNLEGLKDLEFLGITIYSEEVLKKLQSTDRLAESTQRLSLEHCQGMKTIQFAIFQHMMSLIVLFIHSCNELKEVVFDDTQAQSRVEQLILADLQNLERISKGPASHCLQNVRELTIKSCHKLEAVSCVLHLRSLERLVISQCSAMEQVVQEDSFSDEEMTCSIEESQVSRLDGNTKGVDDNNTAEITEGGEIEVPWQSTQAFQKLKAITLKDLKKLESICSRRYFPCLEMINVDACPNLERLPLSCDYNNPKFKQICGPQCWWNKLVWEEDNSKTIFSDHFVPI